DDLGKGVNTMCNLSEGVYGSNSVSAIAIACHECGHAVQDAKAYAPMRARSALVPVVNLGSSVWLVLLLAGIFLNIIGLVWVAIAVFGVAVLFQLVTLPVEFNASSRALDFICNSSSYSGTLSDNSKKGAKTVLRAAALTYVAAALTSILQLLYYISIFGNRN
ncbi:MAG: zinc metallopeptidase, partial [Coriobacteriales bacterium]|nr:zinc metallopeptidase [Coriobacteriales bacterium]